MAGSAIHKPRKHYRRPECGICPGTEPVERPKNTFSAPWFRPGFVHEQRRAVAARCSTPARPRRRCTPPAFCKPLQLLPEFRNVVSCDSHLAQSSERKEGETLSYLPVKFKRQSGDISS